MDKKSSSGLEVSVAGDAPEEKPQFSLELASVLPLQVTLTKTSLQLIKTLVEVCIIPYIFSLVESKDLNIYYFMPAIMLLLYRIHPLAFSYPMHLKL